MTLCPIAVVAGCSKCPAFSICPLKSVLGDYKVVPDSKDDAKPAGPAEAPKRGAARR